MVDMTEMKGTFAELKAICEELFGEGGEFQAVAEKTLPFLRSVGRWIQWMAISTIFCAITMILISVIAPDDGKVHIRETAVPAVGICFALMWILLFAWGKVTIYVTSPKLATSPSSTEPSAPSPDGEFRFSWEGEAASPRSKVRMETFEPTTKKIRLFWLFGLAVLPKVGGPARRSLGGLASILIAELSLCFYCARVPLGQDLGLALGLIVLFMIALLFWMKGAAKGKGMSWAIVLIVIMTLVLFYKGHAAAATNDGTGDGGDKTLVTKPVVAYSPNPCQLIAPVEAAAADTTTPAASNKPSAEKPVADATKGETEPADTTDVTSVNKEAAAPEDDEPLPFPPAIDHRNDRRNRIAAPLPIQKGCEGPAIIPPDRWRTWNRMWNGKAEGSCVTIHYDGENYVDGPYCFPALPPSRGGTASRTFHLEEVGPNPSGAQHSIVLYPDGEY